jgi:S1-C subfamily serine protease
MASLILVAVLLFVPPSAWSEERNRFADVLALQEAVHQSIERAEPAIASILVSRSDKYHALLLPAPREPGVLGPFDLDRARRGMDPDGPEYLALGQLDLSDSNNDPESYGSGVVLDEENRLILTLAHVVRKATKIYVRLPGGRGSWANIHAADPRSDLAVLRLIDPVPNLKALKLGDGGTLRKGDFVLSLSNPFALGMREGSPSASWGIVSNLRRRATGVLSEVAINQRNTELPLYRFNTLIQTDTRMNLGCSGGALLNLQGELVGLTSALAGIAGGETPGGFAVPLDAGMRRIINKLLSGEEVEYGFMGVSLPALREASEGHVRIDKLIPGGPAAQRGKPGAGGFAHINGGDFIHSINGTPVHNNDDLFLAVALNLAGSTVRVVVSAPEGPRRTCLVTLAKFRSLDGVIASKPSPTRGGLRVDWTSTVVDAEKGIEEGVVIREVLPGSPAAEAHLRPGMIIKSVNRQTVTNPAEFYKALDKVHGPAEFVFSKPNGDRRTITIE